MFNKFLLILLLIVSTTFAKGKKGGDVHVQGYYKKNGTYVQPHYRSAPDGNFYNNWSTKGNINPYTGKEGTKLYPNTYRYNYDNSTRYSRLKFYHSQIKYYVNLNDWEAVRYYESLVDREVYSMNQEENKYHGERKPEYTYPNEKDSPMSAVKTIGGILGATFIICLIMGAISHN